MEYRAPLDNAAPDYRVCTVGSGYRHPERESTLTDYRTAHSEATNKDIYRHRYRGLATVEWGYFGVHV